MSHSSAGKFNPLKRLRAFFMQNISVCVLFYRINSTLLILNREVLKVNSPILFCVQIVIVKHTLFQNIVPCG